MTAGDGTGDRAPGQNADETADQGRPERPMTDRPGPLPPRMAPPSGAGHPTVPGQPTGFPAAPGAGVPAAPGTFPAVPGPATAPSAPGAFGAAPGAGGPPASEQAGAGPGQPAVPAPRATWSPTPNSGQWGGPTGTPAAPRPQGGWPPAPLGAAGQPTGVVPPPAQPAGAEPTIPGRAPVQPPAAPAHPGQPASGPSYPGQPTSGPAYPGQATSGPVHPGQPDFGTGHAGLSGPGHLGQSGSAYALSGQPTAGPALPGQPAAAYPGGTTDAPGRRRWVPVVALTLAGVLALVAGVQAYQIHRLDDRLAATDRRLAEAQGADGSRLDGLENRADALEKQAGAAFNPEAVASAVLPSVFRVRAGQFTGTAFAIGKPPAGGGTTLLTNFHVVESVFAGGGRKVFLERSDQRFDATIIRVDKDKDLAQLRTTARFKGLVAAATPVKSGQQIVVVGAPLGLQDTVTTGVVSAFRKDDGGSGPVIQFDAPINPGNSGGPVINGSKEVVGIATAKARDAEGIGLAVPIKTACDTFTLC
ncbi:trypsin-like peptidase domain-containing protein [Micromonospora sp. NPDC005806]|uniref:S1C family serine protease n=1 Tax=Micromonospora sp. NPDC005806 TaxID=3364234 RepID=UPI00369E1565